MADEDDDTMVDPDLLDDAQAKLTDAKTRAALLANEAMKREEATLEDAFNKPELQPVAKPFQQFNYGAMLPTSAGFMYAANPVEGPASPVGPGATPAARVAAATKPAYDPSLTSIDPTARQFAAQEKYRTLITQGVAPEQAILMAGPDLLAGLPPTATATVRGGWPTPYQKAMEQSRESSLAEKKREFDAKQSQSKIHFGPNGQVLEEKDGIVKVVRPPDAGPPKYHGAHMSFPASDFGPAISGPADHPDIIARQKQIEEAANKPWWFRRAYNAITGTGTSPQPQTATNAPPQARVTAPTPRVTTQAQYDALPEGSVYIGQDGKKYRKPEASEE